MMVSYNCCFRNKYVQHYTECKAENENTRLERKCFFNLLTKDKLSIFNASKSHGEIQQL